MWVVRKLVMAMIDSFRIPIPSGRAAGNGPLAALLRGALLAAALAAALPSGVAAQSGKDAKAQPVVVVIARLVPFADRVEALGTTRSNESVQIAANVTERIVELHFEDGQTVAAGDPLVSLDKAEEEAELRAAQAVLQERKLAFERAKKLESRQFTSKAQLDERRAGLLEAESAIGVIRARIADRTVRAPFGGVVGLRNLSVGAMAEPGTPITTLDDLSRIKLDFTVPATHLATLRRGLPIQARTASFGDRVFEGEIASIATRIDPVTRSITARALIPNGEGLLRPGLLMTVTLLSNPRQSILLPEDALIPRGADNHVLVVEGEGAEAKALRRDVKIGVRRPGEVEILEGLAAGERVVTRGTLQVRPGQAVTILSVEEPAAATAAGG